MGALHPGMVSVIDPAQVEAVAVLAAMGESRQHCVTGADAGVDPVGEGAEESCTQRRAVVVRW